MLLSLMVFGPFAAGLVSWLIGRKNENARDLFAIGVTAAELVLALAAAFLTPSLRIGGILAGGLGFMVDGFRSVYIVITAFMWAGTTLFAKEYFLEEREGLNRYWLFVLFTLGATEGVMLSADLMTAFIFFEILSFTSFTWVIHEETPGAVRAGYTYLFIAVIGGLVLFMGLALLWHAAGTLEFSGLRAAVSAAPDQGMILAAGVCILLGFGAKAGMVPVHIWLPKAHPVAPSPASALLSGILTKVGIYGILMLTLNALLDNRLFGLLVLLLGVITMALGAVLALFSVNLKRTLACSSMSQIGFILTGVGMLVLLSADSVEEGAGLAVCGLMLHMVNHSLIKLTLFMAAGVVVMNLHTLTLDEIRGWGRNKRFLKISFALGALGISGVPLFNGYISKTLLHESIVEGIHECRGLHSMLSVIEWVFLISGGITFAYMLKLFICIFVEKNRDEKRQRAFDGSTGCMNAASTAAVFGSSLLMVILGQPAVMKRLAAHMTGFEEILHFSAFSWTNLKGGLTSLLIGGLVYLIIVRRVLLRNGSYVNLWPEKLDLEELVYRPVLTRLLPGVFGSLAALFGENVVLKPLCRLAVFLVSVGGRILDMSTDCLITLFRATFAREKKVRGKEIVHPGLLRTMAAELGEAARPITSNLTFALLMTCIGILVILCAIIYSLVR